ncbi:MAG: hypothetical protein V5A66_02785, partial [Candidatus Thermoplasmatota archaeon]
MKMERWIVSISILLAAGSMTLFSPQNVYRTFPLIFGVVSLTGYVLKRFFIFDTGIFLSVISYLFANSGVPPSVYNLLVIMIFFFLVIGIWFYARNSLLISGFEGVEGDKSDIGLATIRRTSLNEILNTLLIGILLSIVASFLALYSSLEITMGSMLQTLLMVVFSAVVFFIT